MKINKASWATDGANVRLSMPLTKIDEAKRLVHGFASLDNADSQDDIVLAEASQRAFSRFRGNIREMHQPIAVGRMVDFREEEFIDSSGEVFKGIFVTVHVSRGAEDTWQKVLDGTLSGFSIGGNIIDSESQFVKDAGRNIRFVKDYELIELSLVDNPANQLANVFAFEKSADGTSIMTGMIADTKSENVFVCFCTEDGIAKTSSNEELDCPLCELPMENKGWFEYTSDADRTEKVAQAVQKYLSSNDTQETANNEGGVEVADTITKDAGPGETVPDEQAVLGQGAAEAEVEASVEEVEPVAEVIEPEAEAADVSEVDKAEDDLAKMFDTLREEIKKSVEDGFKDFSSTLDEVDGKFSEFTKNVETKFAELEKTHGELSEKFAGLKDQLGKVEKSVGILEGATAVKKSASLGGDSETVVTKKATGTSWGNTFLGVDSLQD
jgi:hypothetical protein